MFCSNFRHFLPHMIYLTNIIFNMSFRFWTFIYCLLYICGTVRASIQSTRNTVISRLGKNKIIWMLRCFTMSEHAKTQLEGSSRNKLFRNMLLMYLEITLSPIHIRRYTLLYDHSKQQGNKRSISRCTNSGSECVMWPQFVVISLCPVIISNTKQ
jgi:hypothetical protein